jgi:hypothetical protein
MSAQNEATLRETDGNQAQENDFTPQWGDHAPRGGRTVLQRILKDGASVPLFLGQTLVNSLRDMGYNSTTSALCEHVDNAIQWGATEIRIYFHQTGKRGEFRTSVLVYDNGKGMAPHVLKVASAFGGSMVYDNRKGIGRYGMGMKAAALSMSPILEVYSWQERRAIYNMTLDVEDVGSNKKNMIELPDPALTEELPSEIAEIMTKYMVFPKNPQESQRLFAANRDDLQASLPESGTIVFMPECDRLTFKTAEKLVDHATKEMARIYRRFIARGLKLHVNNRLVEAFDPTYSMANARHSRVEGLTPTQSQLVRTWPIDIPTSENNGTTTRVKVRLFALPYEQWSGLGRTTLKNSLHVFDDHTVSFMRNDREVEIGSNYPKLKLRKHSDLAWLRLEIDFSGDADEGFGVAANKQGVRLKEYVAEKIVEVIGEEITAVREATKEIQAKRAALKSGSKISEAERRATDAEAFQGKPLPQLTEAEQVALDQNLRALAVTLKRDGETDDEAFARVKESRYLTNFKHDEYWPFYHCDYKFGKVILTLNTAHPFFQRIWQPLSELSNAADAAQEGGDESLEISAGVGATCRETLVGIQSLLLSLARTQSQLSADDADGERRQIFEKLRREWSENLTTQLNAK